MDAVASPLKVRARKRRLWAEDANGNVILDGKDSREVWPDRYVCQGLGGSWKISEPVDGPAFKYFPVTDPGGREAARIQLAHKGVWTLHLPNGDAAATTSGGGLLKAYHCEIGELSTASAPYLAPQRYITVELTPSALGHPSRDAIVVAAVWMSESIISSKISDAAGGD